MRGHGAPFQEAAWRIAGRLAKPRILKPALAPRRAILERVAFTWVHATRSTSLFFEHLHTFR